MTVEAQFLHAADEYHFTAAAVYASGQVVQLPDGRAGVIAGAGKAYASGDRVRAIVQGAVRLLKTASVVLLEGQEIYWVISTNKCSYTGDFVVGIAVEDAAAADTTVDVLLNEPQRGVVDLNKGGWLGNVTAGGTVTQIGGTAKLLFTATNEAQKAELQALDTLTIAQGPIYEVWIAPYDVGDNGALDGNFGIGSAAGTTDFDAVPIQASFHVNGASLQINAESDDGPTDVDAVDTTKDFVDDTYSLLQIDARTAADVKMYVNGVRVNAATTFTLAGATQTTPMFALAHLEKTASTGTGDYRVKKLVMRAGIRS